MAHWVAQYHGNRSSLFGLLYHSRTVRTKPLFQSGEMASSMVIKTSWYLWITFSFEHLRTNITDNQVPLHRSTIPHLEAAHSEDAQLLKVLCPTSPPPISVWDEATISCSESAYLRVGSGVASERSFPGVSKQVRNHSHWDDPWHPLGDSWHTSTCLSSEEFPPWQISTSLPILTKPDGTTLLNILLHLRRKAHAAKNTGRK